LLFFFFLLGELGMGSAGLGEAAAAAAFFGGSSLLLAEREVDDVLEDVRAVEFELAVPPLRCVLGWLVRPCLPTALSA